jgi:hypothetical protein
LASIVLFRRVCLMNPTKQKQKREKQNSVRNSLTDVTK